MTYLFCNYGFSHHSVKWWKRAFCHLLDLALINSHVLYNTATSSHITQLDFRISVAKSMLEGLERPHHHHHLSRLEIPIWLTERAFPDHIPEGKRVDCKVCSKQDAGKRHTTGYRCKLCYTPLRLYPCFERYTIHSKIIKLDTSIPHTMYTTAISSIPNLSTPNMSTIPNSFSTGLKHKKGDNSVK